MASSYTTGFSLEKIGSGEQSGAWGDTTNFNWDIVDRLAAYKAVAITTNADTATLTVREASPGSGTENLQDGMYRMIKFTGALDSNCTVTVAPNTAPAYFIINNATTDSGASGPYSIILSQGSGANITVENGKSAVVYCDGAGSGAAVVDAISNLALATIKTSGTITSGGAVAVTGNVTATGTVEPAGDTAASDNAAFGYTSVLGAIITGQGSTNDVTLVNDADATVLGIATGTTNVDIVGDVTASTVNADGDTAASDNAAMGYTAAEGLILTGQGSTNDITLKNDADGEVFGVPTGTTGVTFKGVIRTDDATDSTSGTSGSIQTDGGIGAVKEIVTDATFQPLGDTAASDKAAVGYTSAEGLILTGQGSTNDVTIKNDADADVLTVPTGTTNVSVAGNLSLSDASSVNISTPLLAGADHTSTGFTAQMLAGGAISAFDLVCIHTVTQEVVEADASAYATARVIGIAPAAISDTATGTILLHGFIRDDTWTWTTGGALYLSETAGAMTHTAPSTDGAFVQVVGVALSPDVVYFNPSMDVIEHA